MHGRSATQAQMPASNGGPADIMKCLAGSSTKPEQPAHPPRETVPTPNANQNQSVAEQMVLNLQEQQLLLQKQLLALQEKQQAVEVAAATTAATSTEDKPRQKVPAQPTDEGLDTRQQSPPAQGAKDQARSKAKTKEQIDSEVQSDQSQEAKGRVTSSCACALWGWPPCTIVATLPTYSTSGHVLGPAVRQFATGGSKPASMGGSARG